MNDAEFESLWQNLVAKKHGDPPRALTEPERLFYAVNFLRGSVPRSGFIGYFEDVTGDDLREAHEALRIMRLEDVLSLLEQAQQIVLRGRPIPAGASPIDLFPEELSEEGYLKALDELDVALTPVQEAFYECDNRLFEALCEFADQHALTGSPPL